MCLCAQELLKLIPEIHAQTRVNESCGGAAIEVRRHCLMCCVGLLYHLCLFLCGSHLCIVQTHTHAYTHAPVYNCVFPNECSQAAVAVLKPLGGKVKAFLSCLPNFGVHALKARDSIGVGEKDKLMFLQSQV